MPRPRKRRFHGARHILNKPGYHTTGVVVAEIEDTSTWHEGCNREGKKIEDEWEITPHAVVQFADCTRTITLGIDMYSEEDRANTRYKIDKLIDALTKFRDGFEIEVERMNERRPIAQAAEKEHEKKRNEE